MKLLGVIPARYGSVRLPGKPLALIKGKPMVRWVYEAARKALPRVVVATDDSRIFNAVREFGGEAMMTPASLQSGTERMAYLARRIKARIYVNVQGDEPLMKPQTIRAAADLAAKTGGIGTAATALALQDRENPNVVKVVLGAGGRALYFSRSLVPYPRGGRFFAEPRKHLGIYAYPAGLLKKFVSLRPTALERTEMLEQLRALYYGLPIHVAWTPHDSVGVDTKKDLKDVERTMSRNGPVDNLKL